MQNKFITKKYEELSVGDTYSFSETITEKLVDKFADLSEDMSPIHVDDSYAKTTEFRQRIGHGMISGLWFSRLIGMYLPGKYALYLSQSINFHKPLLIGKNVIIKGEIIQKTDALKIIKIKTTISDENSKEVLVSGDALVKLLS